MLNNRKRKYTEMINENYINRFFNLDNNIIGIIFSLISDDFNFLLYLRENKIKPYFNPISWYNIDFYYVSNQIDVLDEGFINEFIDRLDWDIITNLQKSNQDFLEKYSDNINFVIISNLMKFDDTLDYNFFFKYKKKLIWNKISQWDFIAEDFIDIFHLELDWGILSKQQGLTRYLLEKYIDNLVIDQFKYNLNINVELKNEIINRRIQLKSIPEDDELLPKQLNQVINIVLTDNDNINEQLFTNQQSHILEDDVDMIQEVNIIDININEQSHIIEDDDVDMIQEVNITDILIDIKDKID